MRLRHRSIFYTGVTDLVNITTRSDGFVEWTTIRINDKLLYREDGMIACENYKHWTKDKI